MSFEPLNSSLPLDAQVTRAQSHVRCDLVVLAGESLKLPGRQSVKPSHKMLSCTYCYGMFSSIVATAVKY